MTPIPDPHGRILEALLRMVIADEDADPEELATLARVYGELTGRTLSAEHLRAHARARLVESVDNEPADLGEGLADADKRQVLAAAFTIATADGFVLEEEEEQLAQLARRLGMSVDATRDALAQLMSARTG